jgi:hypothetical protein
MRKLLVTLEIDIDDMSPEELEAAGFAEDNDLDAELGPPKVDEYDPGEIAEGIPGVLSLPEVKGEILAGSGIFVNIGAISVYAADWKVEGRVLS